MVDSREPPTRYSDDFWRDFLSGGHSKERAGRRVFKLLPHDPRCRLCAAPFAGPAAPIMRLIGKVPSDKNPTWCSSCFTFMKEHRGGAEIECTFLFADIRGSTRLAGTMSSREFSGLMDRFYDTASNAVFDHDGIVDKFVGDELVAMFFPLLTGRRHARAAVDAARLLLRSTGHEDEDGPWVPVGAGVHTGTAWVGAVGADAHVELTAFGDAVNMTARLASAAPAGEILVSAPAAATAGLPRGLERRAVGVKGKDEDMDVVVVPVGVPAGPRT